MCLRTHNKTIYVAHGHKTCYKLLLSDGEGHMFTPYCCTYVPPEVLEGKKNFEAKNHLLKQNQLQEKQLKNLNNQISSIKNPKL